jgi:4-azaleucine resistance transporter AzlC
MANSPFQAGFRAAAPLLPSVVPFGIMAGVAAREAGLDAWASLGMSVIIFAGASQLAAAQLMSEGALPAVIVITALVINLRMVMYSASLAPHLAGLPRYWKWPLAYLITDQAYVVSIGRMLREPEASGHHWYFLGAAFPIWAIWVLATLAGIALGAAVPPAWRLDFAVPLIFLALLVPAVHDRPTLISAVAAAVVALLAHGLPFNLGLITGAACGIAAGVLAELRRDRVTA